MIYCLMAMTRKMTKPIVLLARTNAWEVFPFRDYICDEFSTYKTNDSWPLIRYNNVLFWIERADQPAHKIL